MKKLITLGIITAITENLSQRDDFDPKKNGVLEIACGAGGIAQALKDVGITRYHGVSKSAALIADAKKAVKGYSRKFHTKSVEEVIEKHPHDVIICAQGECPYDAIPAGTILIVVTRGEESWGSCCLKLSPLFGAGAKTVQHGDLYLTIGTRS